MRNIKARYLWIFALILLALAVLLVYLSINASNENSSNKVYVVLMTIDLIAFTFVIQYAIMKSVKYRPKPEKFIEKEYNTSLNISEVLLQNKFKERSKSYGKSYIKIENKIAYKVVLVSDPTLYFSSTEEESQDEDLKRRLDNCNIFIGVEIFDLMTDELNRKIVDFSICTERVYYTALGKQDDNYKCFNYEEPKELQKKPLDDLFNLLGLKEVNNENEMDA